MTQVNVDNEKCDAKKSSRDRRCPRFPVRGGVSLRRFCRRDDAFGETALLSSVHRHCSRESELFHESRHAAFGHDGLPCLKVFGGSLPLSRSHRHCYREPELFKESGRDAASHDRLQYFDGIEQAQLGSSDDCHSDGNVLFALYGPVAKSDFPEKDTVANPGLCPVVCGLNRRVFKEDEEFVFMGYQPLADVVGFVVRQW